MSISTPEANNLGIHIYLPAPYIGKRPVINAHIDNEKPQIIDNKKANYQDFHSKKYVNSRYSSNEYSNQALDIKSSKETVDDALNQGLTPQDGINIYNANRSYGISLTTEKNVVNILSNTYEA